MSFFAILGFIFDERFNFSDQNVCLLYPNLAIVTFTGGSNIGKCGRLSQPIWVLVHIPTYLIRELCCAHPVLILKQLSWRYLSVLEPVLNIYILCCIIIV